MKYSQQSSSIQSTPEPFNPRHNFINSAKTTLSELITARNQINELKQKIENLEKDKRRLQDALTNHLDDTKKFALLNQGLKDCQTKLIQEKQKLDNQLLQNNQKLTEKFLTNWNKRENEFLTNWNKRENEYLTQNSNLQNQLSQYTNQVDRIHKSYIQQKNTGNFFVFLLLITSIGRPIMAIASVVKFAANHPNLKPILQPITTLISNAENFFTKDRYGQILNNVCNLRDKFCDAILQNKFENKIKEYFIDKKMHDIEAKIKEKNYILKAMYKPISLFITMIVDFLDIINYPFNNNNLKTIILQLKTLAIAFELNNTAIKDMLKAFIKDLMLQNQIEQTPDTSVQDNLNICLEFLKNAHDRELYVFLKKSNIKEMTEDSYLSTKKVKLFFIIQGPKTEQEKLAQYLTHMTQNEIDKIKKIVKEIYQDEQGPVKSIRGGWIPQDDNPQEDDAENKLDALDQDILAKEISLQTIDNPMQQKYTSEAQSQSLSEDRDQGQDFVDEQEPYSIQNRDTLTTPLLLDEIDQCNAI